MVQNAACAFAALRVTGSQTGRVRMKRLRMANGMAVALAVLLLAGALHADSRDDLGRAKSDLDSLRLHSDEAKSKA